MVLTNIMLVVLLGLTAEGHAQLAPADRPPPPPPPPPVIRFSAQSGRIPENVRSRLIPVAAQQQAASINTHPAVSQAGYAQFRTVRPQISIAQPLSASTPFAQPQTTIQPLIVYTQQPRTVVPQVTIAQPSRTVIPLTTIAQPQRTIIPQTTIAQPQRTIIPQATIAQTQRTIIPQAQYTYPTIAQPQRTTVPQATIAQPQRTFRPQAGYVQSQRTAVLQTRIQPSFPQPQRATQTIEQPQRTLMGSITSHPAASQASYSNSQGTSQRQVLAHHRSTQPLASSFSPNQSG